MAEYALVMWSTPSTFVARRTAVPSRLFTMRRPRPRWWRCCRSVGSRLWPAGSCPTRPRPWPTRHRPPRTPARPRTGWARPPPPTWAGRRTPDQPPKRLLESRRLAPTPGGRGPRWAVPGLAGRPGRRPRTAGRVGGVPGAGGGRRRRRQGRRLLRGRGPRPQHRRPRAAPGLAAECVGAFDQRFAAEQRPARPGRLTKPTGGGMDG